MKADVFMASGHSVGTAGAKGLTFFFLLLSCILAILCVSTRNIYDDEHTSLGYVNRSVSEIIQTANSGNVHPPGMYLLAHFAFRAIPSPRWMTLVVLALLYIGLAVCAFNLTPLFGTQKEQICFLILATLQPQLLMWGLTIRWYGWWTPLALIVLIDTLQPQSAQHPPQFSYTRAIRIAIQLAALFYINYVTLIFLLALSVSLLYRYSRKSWKQYAVTLFLFALLIFPQLSAFFRVHVAGRDRQRSSVVVSLAHLAESVFTSEAYLPWLPVAIVAFLCFAALLVVGIIRAVQAAQASSITDALLTSNRGLASIVLFSVCFGVLIGASGLGVKPRSALILIPTLAPLFALIIGGLRSHVLQSALIGFLLLWEGIGTEHLVRRHGLAKSNMNDRPEEVVAFIRNTATTSVIGNCPVLVTYDPLLTLDAEESDIPNLLLLAPSGTTLALLKPPFHPNSCNGIDVFWVHSYLGGFGDDGELIDRELVSSEMSHQVCVEAHNFSFDPEAGRKRKLGFLGKTGDLPDYRYVVKSAHLPTSDLPSVLKSLPDFEDAEAREPPDDFTPVDR